MVLEVKVDLEKVEVMADCLCTYCNSDQQWIQWKNPYTCGGRDSRITWMRILRCFGRNLCSSFHHQLELVEVVVVERVQVDLVV
jgi:hypothetical protein